jgi:hypothetical protein
MLFEVSFISAVGTLIPCPKRKVRAELPVGSRLRARGSSARNVYKVHVSLKPRSFLEFFEGLVLGACDESAFPAGRFGSYQARTRSTARHFLVSASIVKRAPRIEASPSADSILIGIWVRPRLRQISALTPMTESTGPLMPMSVM